MIWMFDLVFMNNLQQAPNDNPWLVELINPESIEVVLKVNF